MLRIAICDDELPTCVQIQQIISQFAEQTKQPMTTEIFLSSEKFIEQVNKEHFDLIFLDIEMENYNGVEVGIYLRETLDNQTIHIVYISWSESYCLELFEIRPTNFLKKPLNEGKIIREIKKVQKLVSDLQAHFSYRKNMDLYRIPLQEIIYFESKGRNVRIVTTRYEDIFYGKLSNITTYLSAKKQFIQVHKSFLVNFEHVIHASYEQLQMSNCDFIPISKRKRKDVRLYQLDYEVNLYGDL